MKTKSFFLLVALSFFICFGKLKSEEEVYHTPISRERIPEIINTISNGKLKDEIFWSAIDLFLRNKMNLSTVTKYDIYVSEVGVSFRIDIADSLGNPSVSSVLFLPHNRNESTDAPIFILNEHICICKVKVGFSQIIKRGGEFICVGIAEANFDENIDLECHDMGSLPRFIRTHYVRGKNFEPNLTVIPATVMELTED